MKKLLGIIVFFLIFNTLPVSSEINKKEENLKKLEFVFCKYSNHRQNKTQRNFLQDVYINFKDEGCVYRVALDGQIEKTSKKKNLEISYETFLKKRKMFFGACYSEQFKKISYKKNCEKKESFVKLINKDGSFQNISIAKNNSTSKDKNQILYAKNYDGLLKALNKAKKSEISINLDTISKEYGYKNFKSFLKDFKKNNKIKRLSVEDAKIFFQGYDKNLKIVESEENLDKFHQLIIENKTLRRYTSYFKKKNSDKLKWLVAAVDYKKEMSKITENYNLKKISPFPWGWSSINATDALLNCKKEKQSLGIIFGPECILVDISQNNVHLNVITPKDKIEICIENSKVLYPKKYDTTVKDFRDKRYKAYCSSDLFFLPGKGKKLNRLKTKIESNKFLYAKLEEDNPLLVKIKKEEQEEKRLEKEKLEAKKKKLEAQRKAEKEKLEAKRKEEEEKLKDKKKAEKERLEAKKKEEEEKEKLAVEKRIKQKKLEEKKLSLIPKKTKKEIAKNTLINIQSYIKSNPDEFDILEISEFFIKTRPILEDTFNEQLENDLNSLVEYVKKSSKLKSYLEKIEIREKEKNLKYIDETLSLINEQIAKVTNFLYEKPNSIHAENWLNSVKKAKQRLNNSNSLDEILESSNELGIMISNQETLVKLISESEDLILELKGYLTENLTTDLAPKILENIENLKKSIESESYDNLNKTNDIVKIFLEPKRKTDREEILLKEKKERLALQKKAKKKAEAKKKKLKIRKKN